MECGADSERFKTFVTDDELANLSKGFSVHKNTSNSTGPGWGLHNFQAWTKAHNRRFPNDMVPPDLLQTSDKSFLNTWLSRYIVETRDRNGAYYPPSTLYQLLSGILRAENTSCPNFLDKRARICFQTVTWDP